MNANEDKKLSYRSSIAFTCSSAIVGILWAMVSKIDYWGSEKGLVNRGLDVFVASLRGALVLLLSIAVSHIITALFVSKKSKFDLTFDDYIIIHSTIIVITSLFLLVLSSKYFFN